jgi:hypothetical protein
VLCEMQGSAGRAQAPNVLVPDACDVVSVLS